MTSEESRAGGRRPAHRVVISSVTGLPIAWDGDAAAGPRTAAGGGPIVPDRAAEDAPEPGQDTTNDDRLTRDVPPHWGTGA